MKIVSGYLGNWNRATCFIVMVIGSLFLGIFDYLIGPEISFSVFYIIPIMMAGWYGGKYFGIAIAILSALIWLSADLAARDEYSTLLIPVWNSVVRLAFFSIILWLLLIVRAKLAFEESLAHTDALTGLPNRRFFLEQLEREYARAGRYPESLTIAYFDLDNFKYVNDTMGHGAGDDLLVRVAETLSTSVRESDLAFRLGGDEFAVVFPVLEQDQALLVLEKIQSELLAAMREKAWPVTFSIGAVTFTRLMESSRDMIKLVDDLMYEVKKTGKNNIRHAVWPDPSISLRLEQIASTSHE